MTTALLLVEDDPMDVELIERVFRDLGKHKLLTVVRDGKEALDYLFGEGEFSERATKNVPDLVLLDLRLPKVDGLKVLAELKKNARTRVIPVVILSSSNQESDVSDSYALGANSYLQKPLDLDGLRQLISGVSSYWLGANEPVPRSYFENN